MRILRFLWRTAEAAGTLVWVVSVAAGVAVTVLAAVYGAFEGLPKLAQVVAAIFVFALASVAFLEVVQYARLQAGQRGKPDLRLNTGTSPEYQMTNPAEKAITDDLEAKTPGFVRPSGERIWLLRLREMGSAPAKKVRVRIVATDPPLQDYSLPVPLIFWAEGTSHDLDRGDRAFVMVFYVGMTPEGQFILHPPIPIHNEPYTVQVEVIYGDSDTRADLRCFLLTGPDDEGSNPTVTEVETPDALK